MLIEDMTNILWMSVSVDGHMVDYSHKNVRRESVVKISFNEEGCKYGGVCVHGSGFGGEFVVCCLFSQVGMSCQGKSRQRPLL